MTVATVADAREFARKHGRYRLSCECFAHVDGVKKIPPGWTKVRRVQTLQQALSTYDDDGDPDPPPGYSVADWETHVGLCPECSRAEEKSSRRGRTTKKSVK